jgi:hypothetical protein
MQVKWKKHVARLIPAATMVAAVIVGLSGRGGSVKWG